MIKAQIKFNFNAPNVDLSNELLTVAEKLFIPEIQGNITSGKSIRGGRYDPLAPSTLRIRSKKGQGFTPLKATGILRKSIVSTRIANGARIFIEGQRGPIGDILQNEGVRTKSGRRRFNFFGINAKMERKALIFMREELKKRLRRGR